MKSMFLWNLKVCLDDHLYLSPPPLFLLRQLCRSWRIFWVNNPKLSHLIQSPGRPQCLSEPGPQQAPSHCSGTNEQNLLHPARENTSVNVGFGRGDKIFSSVLLLGSFFWNVWGKKWTGKGGKDELIQAVHSPDYSLANKVDNRKYFREETRSK